MRVKPTEVKLLAAKLEAAFTEAEAGDAELDLNSLAEELVVELDEKRRRDDSNYAAVVYVPLGEGGTWLGLGPFSTHKAAQNAALGVVAPGPQPGVGRVVKLRRELPD